MVSVSRVPVDDEGTRDAVEAIGREAFPSLQGWLVSPTDHTLVARHDGAVVGGVVLKVEEVSPGTRVGLLNWIFTAERARGLGAGQRLLEAAIEYLADRGCERVLAVIEWKNTSSSKLFATRGFEPIATREAVAEYGLGGTLSLWRHLLYYLAPGHHLWARRLAEPDANAADGGDADEPIANEDETESPTRASRGTLARRARSIVRFAEATAANVVLLLVVVAASSGVALATAHAGGIALVAVAFLAIRHLPRRVATALDDEPWRYRSWGNGYPLSLAIAAVGGYLPVPGGLEPADRAWTYRLKLGLLGPASFVSAVALVGTVAVLVLGDGLPVVDLADRTVRTLTLVAIVYLVLDVLAIVWPFDIYNARVLYDWNRLAWAIVAVPAALLLVVWAV